jgi:hypothetical protein
LVMRPRNGTRLSRYLLAKKPVERRDILVIALGLLLPTRANSSVYLLVTQAAIRGLQIKSGRILSGKFHGC